MIQKKLSSQALSLSPWQIDDDVNRPTKICGDPRYESLDLFTSCLIQSNHSLYLEARSLRTHQNYG